MNSRDFDARFYLDFHSDLPGMGVSNPTRAWQHWCSQGPWGNRIARFRGNPHARSRLFAVTPTQHIVAARPQVDWDRLDEYLHSHEMSSGRFALSLRDGFVYAPRRSAVVEPATVDAPVPMDAPTTVDLPAAPDAPAAVEAVVSTEELVREQRVGQQIGADAIYQLLREDAPITGERLAVAATQAMVDAIADSMQTAEEETEMADDDADDETEVAGHEADDACDVSEATIVA